MALVLAEVGAAVTKHLQPRMRDLPCEVEGCPKNARVRGLCSMHYERWRSTGDPGAAHEKRPAVADVITVECPICGTPFSGKPSQLAQTCSRACGQRFRRQRDGLKKIERNGYIYVWKPEHPMALAYGYVAEHRMVAWDHGILTDPAHHVHHINGVKDDNRPENLEALTESEHHRHHVAEAGYIVNQYGRFPLRGGVCSVDGCDKDAQTRGWCIAHYIRWQRSGDPLGKSTWRRSA